MKPAKRPSKLSLAADSASKGSRSRGDRLALELNRQREAFKAFLVARIGNDAEAEDLLQNGLLKAVQRAGEIESDAKLTAWFYQELAMIARGAVRVKASTEVGSDMREKSAA